MFDRFRGVLPKASLEGTHFLIPFIQSNTIYDLRTRPTASFAQNRASHAFASSPSLPHASPHSTDHPGAKTASDNPSNA